MTDWDLIQNYIKHRSEVAFSRLVERHLTFVYQVCRRETNDQQVAEDATLAVFLLLSKKAHTIRNGVQLTSWLFTVARLTARNAAQQESRRKARERKAGAMAQHKRQFQNAMTAEDIDSHLNDALAALSQREREAVLLRYQEELDVADVGRVLGISESAVKMRLSRALEKMRNVFAKKGTTLGTSIIIVALLAAKSEAAPAALYVKAMSFGAVGLATTSHLVLLQNGVLFLMEATKLKTAAGIAVVLVGLLGFGGVVAWNSFAGHARTAIVRDTTPPAERSALANQLQQYTSAFNRKDLTALRSVLAPDTAIREANPSGTMGKEQIIADLQRTFEKNPNQTVHFTLIAADIHGDHATAEVGVNSSTDGSNARGNKGLVLQWVKYEGKWMIASMRGN